MKLKIIQNAEKIQRETTIESWPTTYKYASKIFDTEESRELLNASSTFINRVFRLDKDAPAKQINLKDINYFSLKPDKFTVFFSTVTTALFFASPTFTPIPYLLAISIFYLLQISTYRRPSLFEPHYNRINENIYFAPLNEKNPAYNKAKLIHETIHWLGYHQFLPAQNSDTYLARATQLYYLINHNKEIPFDLTESYNPVTKANYVSFSKKAFDEGYKYFEDGHSNQYEQHIDRINHEKTTPKHLKESYNTGMFVGGVIKAMLDNGGTKNQAESLLYYLSQGNSMQKSLGLAKQ